MSAAPLLFSPSHNIWPVTGSDTPVVGSWIRCAIWVRQVHASALAGQGPGSLADGADDVTGKTKGQRNGPTTLVAMDDHRVPLLGFNR